MHANHAKNIKEYGIVWSISLSEKKIEWKPLHEDKNYMPKYEKYLLTYNISLG